jgi:hypothetical protein
VPVAHIRDFRDIRGGHFRSSLGDAPNGRRRG